MTPQFARVGKAKVRRTGDVRTISVKYVGVGHCRSNISVVEWFRHGSRVVVGFDQMSRKTMAEGVRCHPLRDIALPHLARTSLTTTERCVNVSAETRTLRTDCRRLSQADASCRRSSRGTRSSSGRQVQLASTRPDSSLGFFALCSTRRGPRWPACPIDWVWCERNLATFGFLVGAGEPAAGRVVVVGRIRQCCRGRRDELLVGGDDVNDWGRQ